MRNEINQLSDYFLRNYDEKNNIDVLWEGMKEEFLRLINKYVPSKFTTTKPSQPWIDAETKRLLRKKKKWFKRAKSSQSAAVQEKYKDIKRLAQKQCRRAHTSFLNNIIEEDDKNQKKFWS